jgi:hypothetical protein
MSLIIAVERLGFFFMWTVSFVGINRKKFLSVDAKDCPTSFDCSQRAGFLCASPPLSLSSLSVRLFFPPLVFPYSSPTLCG